MPDIRGPKVERSDLGTPDPKVVDATVRVRGIGLAIRTPDGQEWRSAMIDVPFFPAATPQAFYDLQVASAKKNYPNAMKAFAGAHPEIDATAGALLQREFPGKAVLTVV